MRTIPPHPLCSVWPQMTVAEKHELIDDIKANGVLEPVVLLDGKILDGFHRYNAARAAGVSCNTKELAGDDPAGFVISRNAKRRHMTKRTLAIAVAGCREWAPPNIKVADLPEQKAAAVKTTQQMADEAGVSKSTMASAKRVVRGVEPADPPPPTPKPAAARKVATQEIIDLKDRQIFELEERVVGYEERLKSFHNSASKESAKRDEVVVNQRAEISTLKSQLREWQAKYNEANKMAKTFERKAKSLQGRIDRINLAA